MPVEGRIERCMRVLRRCLLIGGRAIRCRAFENVELIRDDRPFLELSSEELMDTLYKALDVLAIARGRCVSRRLEPMRDLSREARQGVREARCVASIIVDHRLGCPAA